MIAYPLGMLVRRVSKYEAIAYRGLRLQALADAPDAFESTYEGESRRSEKEWERWFTSRALFVAEDADATAIGLVAGLMDSDDPDGAGHVTSMWVHPRHRGTGAADALIGAVILWAQDAGVSSLSLDVAADNHRARRFYARHGFMETGVTLVRERDGALELEMRRR